MTKVAFLHPLAGTFSAESNALLPYFHHPSNHQHPGSKFRSHSSAGSPIGAPGGAVMVEGWLNSPAGRSRNRVMSRAISAW